MNNNRILFIYKNLSTFIQTDISIIKQSFQLKSYSYYANKKLWLNAVEQVKLLFWIFGNIFKAKAIYIWFADYHSLIPILLAKLFKKPSYLVIGGYDVASIPEIGYGSLLRPFRAFFVRYSIKYASLNLPTSQFLAEDLLKISPEVCYKTIYPGLDINSYIASKIPKENSVITVTAGDTEQRIILKGIDIFLEIAEKIPEVKFIIVGLERNIIAKLMRIPPNAIILKKTKQSELVKYYQKSKVYAQFSIREGFGCALAEAMLCECIPVGFNNGAIPFVIGETGFIVDNKDIKGAITAIKKAIADSMNLGKSARNRIIDNFSLEKREEKILNLIRK